MHPTDIKNIIIGTIIILLAIALNVFCAFISLWFIAIFIANLIFISSKDKLGIQPYLVFLAIFSILTNLSTLLIAYLASIFLSVEPYTGFSVPIGGFIFIIVIYPQLSIEKWFKDLLIFIKHEKIYYDEFLLYPDLICTKHKARTIEERRLFWRKVKCNINKECGPEHLEVAEKIIGLVGKQPGLEKKNNNYYVTIWDPEENEIQDGDFDSIEIHENENIENYDAVINKIISYLYNQIERFKPTHQIVVKLIGNIKISENTKRLLESNFLKVEYASNG